MSDELRTALEAERGAWHEFYNDRATADELEAACAATDAAVAALRAKAHAADRVRELADTYAFLGATLHDVPRAETWAEAATEIRAALDGDQP